MPRGFTPPSQRFRPIGFNLSGGGAGGTFGLNIRPESLSRVEPSRLAVQQTLGGAWADAFGRGVATIRIAGTTGWHGGPPDGAPLSGEAAFLALRAGAFTGWHNARDAVLRGGGDPSVVELLFLDTLNGISALVAPKTFTLSRSKTSPLLMRYNIELLVLADGGAPAFAAADAVMQAIADPQGFAAGAAALQGAAAGIAAVLGA